jgi:hypothetical protein
MVSIACSGLSFRRSAAIRMLELRTTRLSDFPLDPLAPATIARACVDAVQRDARFIENLLAQAVSPIVSGVRSIIWTV